MKVMSITFQVSDFVFLPFALSGGHVSGVSNIASHYKKKHIKECTVFIPYQRVSLALETFIADLEKLSFVYVK